MRVEKPEFYVLSQIPWQFFVTLTFLVERFPEVTRKKMWFGFARSQAQNFGVHFKQLLWVLRSEHGEQNGRFHYHALIGGLPQHALTIRTCFAIAKSWEFQTNPVELMWYTSATGKRVKGLHSRFCGFADVRVFQPELGTFGYFLKDVIPVSTAGKSQFEARKFGSADTVEFSESCFRFIEARSKRDEFSRRSDSMNRGVSSVPEVQFKESVQTVSEPAMTVRELKEGFRR